MHGFAAEGGARSPLFFQSGGAFGRVLVAGEHDGGAGEGLQLLKGSEHLLIAPAGLGSVATIPDKERVAGKEIGRSRLQQKAAFTTTVARRVEHSDRQSAYRDHFFISEKVSAVLGKVGGLEAVGFVRVNANRHFRKSANQLRNPFHVVPMAMGEEDALELESVGFKSLERWVKLVLRVDPGGLARRPVEDEVDEVLVIPQAELGDGFVGYETLGFGTGQVVRELRGKVPGRAHGRQVRAVRVPRQGPRPPGGRVVTVPHVLAREESPQWLRLVPRQSGDAASRSGS